MLMRWAAGVLYAVTALVTGYWGLQAMFTPSGGGRFFWWPLIMFGAPILLLVGGILAIFPQAKKRWLVTLAGTILLVVWVALIRNFSKTYLIFAVVVILITWAVLALASALRNAGVVPFIASLTLAASWLPGSVYAFHAYLVTIPPIANALLLLPLLVPWALIMGSIIIAALLFRFPGHEGVRE